VSVVNNRTENVIYLIGIAPLAITALLALLLCWTRADGVMLLTMVRDVLVVPSDRERRSKVVGVARTGVVGRRLRLLRACKTDRPSGFPMNMSDPIGTSTRVVTCIYCEEQKPVTADHVPPTNLLDRPFPPNLLIVPACSDCNGWFSKDDEYFRISLTITDKAKG
jgi:hypothetical protein